MQIRAELKDPICFAISSLRKNGNNNKISKIISSSKEHLNKNILQRMQELKELNKNFIVLFSDT